MEATQAKRSSCDRGVTPVVGVILLLVITIVLATVIGAFAFGLTDRLDDPAPTTSLTMGWTDDDGEAELTITHQGGDRLAWVDVRVTVDGPESTVSDAPINSTNDSIAAGETVRIDESLSGDGEYTIRVVHEPSGSIVGSHTVTVSVS